MTRLRFFTPNSVALLRQRIPRHIDDYYALISGEESLPFLSTERDIESRSSGIDVPSLNRHLVDDQERGLCQAEVLNSMAVYTALRQLSRAQAMDEKLWDYLTHTDYASYVAKRWLRLADKGSNRAKRRVLNHFLAGDNPEFKLIHDNGISRLWWLGHFAHKAAPNKPKRFLEIVLYQQDIRCSLLERHSFSMNTEVLRSIYGIMEEFWSQNNLDVFKRDIFRTWMRTLYKRSRETPLDLMYETERSMTVLQEARRALRQHGYRI